MKPIHEHDCEKCAFLGNIDGKVDVYACWQYESPTWVARFSSEGPDCTSWSEWSVVRRNIQSRLEYDASTD